MSKRFFNGLGLALALVSAGCLTVGCATGSKSNSLPTYSDSGKVRANATVVAIDQRTREVTLRDEQGEEIEFVAGPEVRNLAQVEVGDRVIADYEVSIALRVTRSDGSEPTLDVRQAASGAEPGQLPAGVVSREIYVSARIESIDRAARQIVVRGPRGNSRAFRIKDPKNLENVQVGDMVHVTYTEAVVISLERASK